MNIQDLSPEASAIIVPVLEKASTLVPNRTFSLDLNGIMQLAGIFEMPLTCKQDVINRNVIIDFLRDITPEAVAIFVDVINNENSKRLLEYVKGGKEVSFEAMSSGLNSISSDIEHCNRTLLAAQFKQHQDAALKDGFEYEGEELNPIYDRKWSLVRGLEKMLRDNLRKEGILNPIGSDTSKFAIEFDTEELAEVMDLAFEALQSQLTFSGKSLVYLGNLPPMQCLNAGLSVKQVELLTKACRFIEKLSPANIPLTSN